MTLGEARELEIPEVTEDVGRLLYGQPFQIPAQFAFTGKAIGTLIGVSTGLAPDFNFVDVATPYARKFLGLDAEGIGQTAQQIFTQLLDGARIMLTLPRSIEQLITRLETGQIEVKTVAGTPEPRSGSRRRRRRSNGNGNGNGHGTSPLSGLTWVALFAASLTGGIILTNVHQVIGSWLFLGLAALTGLRMLIRR
jgi:predicted unusual protein kinase regulating ubiquinone biosynthesis (AarF/ABC1/UbiB family)